MFRTWTYGKEYPLQCFIVFVTSGVECELMLLVVMRGEVNQDGGTLEYFEVATRVVNESRNTSIRVDLMRAHSSVSLWGVRNCHGNTSMNQGSFCTFLLRSIFSYE